MSETIQALADIEAAFRDAPKPEHFMDHTHCEECAQHDELLRTRDRDTLRIEDVGNVGWQPLSSCSPEGMAYYMPALARLALTDSYAYGWYGDTLHIHLSCNGSENAFLKHCTPRQRQAVANFLRYLNTRFTDTRLRLTEPEEMEQCAATWSPRVRHRSVAGRVGSEET